jgi:dihydroneopterin aldolase
MNTPKHDQIIISGLDLPSKLGVPYAERAEWQNLTLDLVISLRPKAEVMMDNLEKTVDYSLLTDQIRKIAAAKPRHLLESLALDIAQAILQNEMIFDADITLKKRILPYTNYIAFHLYRSQN